MRRRKMDPAQRIEKIVAEAQMLEPSDLWTLRTRLRKMYDRKKAAKQAWETIRHNKRIENLKEGDMVRVTGGTFYRGVVGRVFRKGRKYIYISWTDSKGKEMKIGFTKKCLSLDVDALPGNRWEKVGKDTGRQEASDA